MSSANRLIKNTAYHAGGRVWQVAVALFMAPFILSYLGDDQFALWALFWSFSSYFMFMDFGLGVSVVREVAQCASLKEYDSINKAMSSVAMVYILLGMLVSLLSYFFSPWLIHFSDISSEMKVFLSQILLGAGGIFALIGVVNLLSALLRGLQCYELITKAMIYVSFPNIVGVYIALSQGYGVLGLLWVVTIVYILQIILLLYYIKKVLPKLEWGWRFCSWQKIKEMLPFGMQIQVSKFAELASYQGDKLLLAFLMPIHFVTMYDLGARIASLMRDLPYALTSAVFPAASELNQQADYDKLWNMYARGSKYLLVVTIPMLLGLWLTAHLVIGMWLGHVSIAVYQSVLILSFAYWLVISLAMCYSVGLGLGWSKPIMESALLQAVLNIVLSYVLIRVMGFVGALLGTLIAIGCANSVLYFRFCRDHDLLIRNELVRLWLVCKANILPLLLCSCMIFFGDFWLVWGDRLQSLMFFLAVVPTYIIIYIFSLRAINVFDGEDLRLLGDKIPLFRKIIG